MEKKKNKDPMRGLRMETVDGHEREGAVLPPRMQARRV